MTHTPGPWGDERKTVIVRGLTWVAHAHYPSEEGQANAKLIAAAPEMLAVLTAIDDMWSDDGEGGRCNPINARSETVREIWEQIRAVIAKATT